MNLRYYTLLGSISAITTIATIFVPSPIQASEQGVEELTRGPVHEAFAASVSYDPEPGMFVSIAPPGQIEEVPPDQRPSGDNVSWIPGYWGWDDETTDFIWISGVWRNMPPGRQWTPGYWGEAQNQWRWTSGYWADSDLQEISYLPKPPKSLESGPSVAAPSHNHLWVSGTWVNREERYAWRPGYWEAGQQDWSWTPAHYQWTPRGYVFIEGYWDYDYRRRGVVFAPVRFNHTYYNRPDYSYTPLIAIALDVFIDHLFVRPRNAHYYFGDYYAPKYLNDGYYASFSYHSGKGGYDPLYAQARWQHRNDRGWEQGRHDSFDYYRSHEDARPARTWAALQAQPASKRDKQEDYQYAQPLPAYVTSKKDQRFQAVSAEGRSKFSEQNKRVHATAKERRESENRPTDKATEGPDKRIHAKREKSIPSPLAGKPAAQFSVDETKPPSRETKPADQTNDRKTQTEKPPKTKRDEPADPLKEDADKAPSEKRAVPKQEKKHLAPQEVAPSPAPNPRRKTEQTPKPPKREQATPQPSREPEPKQPQRPDPPQQPAAPEKPQQERKPEQENSKKKDKNQAPEGPKKN